MEQSRKRPLEQEQGLIKLSVKGQDGVSVYFQIVRTQSMLKLLQAYCLKRNVEYRTMRFLYNGERFSVKHSPGELGMEENDEIEAFMYQTGGGSATTENTSQ